MALRKASSYTKQKGKAYTRSSSKKNKNYIKTKPQQNIIRFRMGQRSDYHKGKFKNMVKLVSGEELLIRDNALEAARKHVLRVLQKKIPEQFYFEVKPFPHHVLRENKVYSGASKGDRYNTGMSQSFGTVMGRAAKVKKNQTIFLVAFLNKQDRPIIVKALEKVKAKLPCHSKLSFEKLD